MSSFQVVKVGGSLYDWPELKCRLRDWLNNSAQGQWLLVPGGGPAADVVRSWDRWHQLGEETAHWLALRSLSLAAYFLAELVPQSAVISTRAQAEGCWQTSRIPILDPHAFAVADDNQPGCLPHTWDVTSDALAVRVALAWGGSGVVLLKSASPPLKGTDWEHAAREGYVDPMVPLLAARGVPVRAVNLRRGH